MKTPATAAQSIALLKASVASAKAARVVDSFLGRVSLGAAWEKVQMKDGSFRTCKVELYRRADGERQFGEILEVL